MIFGSFGQVGVPCQFSNRLLFFEEVNGLLNSTWTFFGSKVDSISLKDVSIETAESFLQNRDEGLGLSAKFVVLIKDLIVKVSANSSNHSCERGNDFKHLL